MTAEVCRVIDGHREVKNRDLLPGQTLRGNGLFSDSKIPVPVVVTALNENEGIVVQPIGPHKTVDTSVADHYDSGVSAYTLTRRTISTDYTVFRLYPH